jgi:hypothetical protein
MDRRINFFLALIKCSKIHVWYLVTTQYIYLNEDGRKTQRHIDLAGSVKDFAVF